MGRPSKKEMPMWAKTGHRKPVTRREFLAHGLIPFAASALVPGALGLLCSPFARAETVCAGASGLLPTFVTINLSGGAGLSANYLPRLANGVDLLPSYSKLGGGTSSNLTLAPQFAVNGVGPFNANSRFLAGLLGAADADTVTNTAFAAICVQSRDDTAENKFDASGMVYKAGLVGSMLPNMGTQATSTGINQKPSTMAPPAPLVVRSVNDLANSIGYTRALATSLSADQRLKLAKLVSDLNGSQTAKLNSVSGVKGVKDLVECAGIKNVDLIQEGSGAIDPAAQNSAVASEWGINTGTSKTNSNYIYAAMVYNSLVGNGGIVNIQLGGYDYHDGSRSTGDNRDNTAGTVIGHILDTAKILGKKIFVYVTSDGATTSRDSDNPGAPWVSDRGTGGLALMFMYDPAGKPTQASGFQIGQFTAGQVADETHFVGADPAQAAQAAFANYLSFSKRLDLLGNILPRGSTLDGAVLQGVLKV